MPTPQPTRSPPATKISYYHTDHPPNHHHQTLSTPPPSDTTPPPTPNILTIFTIMPSPLYNLSSSHGLHGLYFNNLLLLQSASRSTFLIKLRNTILRHVWMLF